MPISVHGAKIPFPNDHLTLLGGTDAFGGVNASGGGWGKADASDVVSLCIFPDLSSIDSWGLTYHRMAPFAGPI